MKRLALIVVALAFVLAGCKVDATVTVDMHDDGSGRGVSSPGYTIEAVKGTPTSVTYVSNLPAQHLFDNEVPDYMHAGSPVRMSTHLHGGHVLGSSDGNPSDGCVARYSASDVMTKW